MNNTWNKIIYKIGSTFYDQFFNAGMFLKTRKRIFQEVPFQSKQKILYVGIGTGADLELINYEKYDITAIDYSPDMLAKAKRKFEHSSIKLLEMDAQKMTFEDESFDYIVASLILSVVPDDNKCMQEMIRVLKQDGRILIFDKFAPKNQKISFIKKLIRPFISILGTDIGRSFEELFKQNEQRLKMIKDDPVMLRGMYRYIEVIKCK
ncbi:MULTISPECIES: class I SAM-dependent methyltransferase [Lysinibacillus]|uniref:Class I SAM-dependent methyltransferase n=1 Tax=Lysinibacillus irui TaxID=2998077 RepID=A0AAJ5RH68_9BACI|nr:MULTISPECIES: class I SAM-dependent methyltransferase [Lysinibacillus]WDV04941.1 class I SAM-dependent methyltransferase [Lysinibacillus irui]